MSHVYGVVPSRRLGRSLGISTIPFKTCNYSCIYCQLGRTTNMTDRRQSFYPYEEILCQARDFISRYGEDSFDVVSIVGEGEPTLFSPLDEITKGLRELTSRPLVLITNGSLLHDVSTRNEIMDFDIVMPTLDAFDQESFRRINRPFGKLSFESVFEGLAKFSREFDGEIWLEVMLIKGYNDDRNSLAKLNKEIETVNPHRVYINVPARPPAENYVKIPDENSLEFAKTLLGATGIEKLPESSFLSVEDDAFGAVLEIIKRHPMTEIDIEALLREKFGEESAEQVLRKLDDDASVEKSTYRGKVFYRYASR